MSHALRRRLLPVAVATTSLALIGAPASGAATKKISKTDKAQNSAIKKVGKTATSASKAAKKAAKDATTGIANAKTAAGKADSAQGGVNAILAGVPAITDGLTKLAAGLTQAGAGLTTLGNAFAAQEYGVVKVQVSGVDAPGAILTSSDIPDDSNAATVTGSVVVGIPTGATAVPITLLAGVRSGEADGTGADNPVASAGIAAMTVTSPIASPGVIVGGGNGAPVAALPIISKPNAALGGAPLYNIPLKAPRVDATPNPYSFPTDKAIDLTAAATLNDFGGGVGPYTVTNNAGVPVAVTVTFTVRFNDLTASATDVTA
jgi:hypothetical protein